MAHSGKPPRISAGQSCGAMTVWGARGRREPEGEGHKGLGWDSKAGQGGRQNTSTRQSLKLMLSHVDSNPCLQKQKILQHSLGSYISQSFIMLSQSWAGSGLVFHPY